MWLTNPDDPAKPFFETTPEAFELLWQYRGWVECEPPLEVDPDDPDDPDVDRDPVLVRALIEEPADPDVDDFPPDVDDDPQPDPEAAPSGDTKE